MAAFIHFFIDQTCTCYSMTGVKAYMTGKIKVKGDLLLAQRLEEVFEKLGGREVFIALHYIANQ